MLSTKSIGFKCVLVGEILTHMQRKSIILWPEVISSLMLDETEA